MFFGASVGTPGKREDIKSLRRNVDVRAEEGRTLSSISGRETIHYAVKIK